MNNNLFELKQVSFSVAKQEGLEHKILDKISFNVGKDEIIAVLGKSGCGKSTLLRIIAGIANPTKGRTKFYQDTDKQSFGISMVFQTFALFPWMTVLENVELGLEAMDIDPRERRARALKAIDQIGLDGFESAYPRELSGGMKQRVGFARALVVNPEIMLLDEPFSALDVLTAQVLKNDFLELWSSKKTSLRAAVIVMHNIEEVVMMADRAIIMGSNPGHIVSEIAIPLPRPRKVESPEFKKLVDKIYSEMTNATHKILPDTKKSAKDDKIGVKLSRVSPHQLAAVAHSLTSPIFKGAAELAVLAKSLHVGTEEIFKIAESLSILKLANVKNGAIKLTKEGKAFAVGNLEQRKKIFATSLKEHVHLAAYILSILHGRPDNKAKKIRFQSHLEDTLSRADANATMQTIIGWGRYGELFSYDDDKQIFSLDNPGGPGNTETGSTYKG